MTENTTESQVPLKVIPRFIMRKDKLTNFTYIRTSPQQNQLFKQLKSPSRPILKEDIIYQSTYGDFLKLHDHRVTVLNRYNLSDKTSRTVARYERSGSVFLEKTSDTVTSLIGKENYNLVFSALCSVISQELKIRGLLALLTVTKEPEHLPGQSGVDKLNRSKMIDSSCQTEESSFNILIKGPPRRRLKRQHPAPYVVMDVPEKITKVVINPSDFKNFTSDTVSMKSVSSETSVNREDKTEDSNATGNQNYLSSLSSNTELPVLAREDLGFDEDSRDSIGGFSQKSYMTTSDIMKAPLLLINNTIDQQTQKSNEAAFANVTYMTMLDGTVVPIPVKVEDEFHIATPQVLKHVSPEHRKKLLWYQLYIDWKYCLKRNDENLL